MMTMMTIAMMAMIMKKATIVIWEPMSLVCAILATIRMHINDSDIHWYKIGLLLEWAGQERPMRQKSSSSQHSAFLAKNHWLNANCSKEVCKLVDVHPERLMGRFLPQWTRTNPSTNSSLSFTASQSSCCSHFSLQWLLAAAVNVSCPSLQTVEETRAANLVAKIAVRPSTWWALAVVQ